VLVAVIGVGGVLVGAASSGLVQALLARAERKRDGRNAARVVLAAADGEQSRTSRRAWVAAPRPLAADDGRFHPLSPEAINNLGCSVSDAHGNGFVNVSLQLAPASADIGYGLAVGYCVPTLERYRPAWRAELPSGSGTSVNSGVASVARTSGRARRATSTTGCSAPTL
jgi:hypothetical protein